MKILVCGGREFVNYYLVFSRVNYYHTQVEPIALLVHGGCRGADERGGRAAAELEIPVAVYPAQWNEHGKAAGMIRNQQMLDCHPDLDLVIAFHEDIKNSRGTRDMIRRAWHKGIVVELASDEGIVFPYTGE